MSDTPTNRPQPCPPPIPRQATIEYQTTIPTTPPPRPGFSIHWSGVVCCLLATVACAALSAAQPARVGQSSAERAGEVAGTVFAVLLFCGVLSFGAFYAFRRSRLAATITVSLMAGLMVMGQLGTFVRRTQSQQAMQRVQSQVAQFQQQLAQQAESADLNDAAQIDQADQLAKTMDRASKDLSGEDAAAAGVSSVAMAIMAKAARDLQDSVAAVAKESPLNPTWVQTRDDLQRSRKHIEAMQMQSANLRKVYDTMPTMLSVEMKKRNLPTATSQRLLSDIASQMNRQRPRFTAIRDIDDQLAVVLLQTQTLLEQNWGRWRVQGKDDLVIFDRDDDAQQFNTLLARARKLGEQQIALQREHLKAAAQFGQ